MLTRRSLLLGATATSLTGCVGTQPFPSPNVMLGRSFLVECAHEGRSCAIGQSSEVTREEVLEFSSVARDWREDAVQEMDRNLLSFLKLLNKQAPRNSKFLLLSGYRTYRTNSSLSGTASNSLHMRAKAMDIRHETMDIEKIRDIAIENELGGVGFYPGANNVFVHLDTSAFRTWVG